MSNTHLPPFWAQHVCAVLGAPQRSETIRFLNAWAQAEGGSARWNPLNSTMDQAGASDYNSTGVKNYLRPVWGVCATAMTLTNGSYGKIVGHLQAGSYTAERIVDDCADQIKTWGTDPDVIRAALKGL